MSVPIVHEPVRSHSAPSRVTLVEKLMRDAPDHISWSPSRKRMTCGNCFQQRSSKFTAFLQQHAACVPGTSSRDVQWRFRKASLPSHLVYHEASKSMSCSRCGRVSFHDVAKFASDHDKCTRAWTARVAAAPKSRGPLVTLAQRLEGAPSHLEMLDHHSVRCNICSRVARVNAARLVQDHWRCQRQPVTAEVLPAHLVSKTDGTVFCKRCNRTSDISHRARFVQVHQHAS